MKQPRPMLELDRRAFLGAGLGSFGVLVLERRLVAAPEKSGPAPLPMDGPLRLINAARAGLARVRDYSCVLIKREQVDGILTPNHVIAMKVRNDPFSVHLRWQEPAELKGQEACYVAGKLDGKMRVRPAGLLAAVGWVTLSPDDPRVRKSSRHSIAEAGLSNLVERYGKAWEAERKENLTLVRLGMYEFNKRRCTRAEMLHPVNPGGRFLYHRSILYFDAEHGLPVRVENYDWPVRPDVPGDLVEMYSYVNLKLNPGLADAVFNR